MPQSQRLYLRVGVLVVFGLALAVGFILFLTAYRLGAASTVYETYFRESVQGIEVGAPVRYRGVAVGRVTEIGLVSAEYRRPQGEAFIAAFQLVLVRFTVDHARVGEIPSVQDAIRLGLRVRIASQGITGVNYLELDFLDPERHPGRDVPWEPHFTYIPSVPSTVAQVRGAAETLLQRLQEADLPGMLANLNGLVTDLRAQVRQGELAMALHEATDLLRTLRAETERADIAEAVAELRATAADARAGECPRAAPRAGERGGSGGGAARRGEAAAGHPRLDRGRGAHGAQRRHRPAGGPGADPARPARRRRQPARRDGDAAPLPGPGPVRRPATAGGTAVATTPERR